MLNRTYTTYEAAEFLGVSARWIQALIKKELIKAKKIGRDYVINERDLLILKEKVDSDNSNEEKKKHIGRPRTRTPKKLSYVSNPSKDYSNMVESIIDFVEKEGLDNARRAFSDATSQLTRSEIMVGFKERAQSHVCIYRLLGEKKCLHNEENESPILSIPGQDHLSEWTKDKITEKIISQPYNLSFEQLKDMILFCQDNRLRVDFSGFSWHFPGRTFLVEFAKDWNLDVKTHLDEPQQSA